MIRTFTAKENASVFELWKNGGSVALMRKGQQKLRCLFFRQPTDKTVLPVIIRRLVDADIALCVSCESIRYRWPTMRLRWRNTLSSKGTIRITQQWSVEWSTEIPRSAIISSRLRRLSEYARYQRTHWAMISTG